MAAETTTASDPACVRAYSRTAATCGDEVSAVASSASDTLQA